MLACLDRVSNIASSQRAKLTFGVHYVLDGYGYSMKPTPLIAWNSLESTRLAQDEVRI